MENFDLIKYNRLLNLNPNELIILYLKNNFYNDMLNNILIKHNRILEKDIDISLLTEFIKKISLEDVWYLASLSHKFIVSKLAYKYLLNYMDELEVNYKRTLIKIIK